MVLGHVPALNLKSAHGDLLMTSLGIFLRDNQHAVGPSSVVLMYTSAVFYTANMIPPAIYTWTKYDHLVNVIEQARAVLLWNQPLHWAGRCSSFFIGLTLLGISPITF